MPNGQTTPARGSRTLDLLNFFIANVQTGFGPLVAVYLTTHKWTQVEIGFALSLGTTVALISQIPAGALIDAAYNKRRVASVALICVIIAALLLAIQPTVLPVLTAQVLHAFASCMLTPAIAAISLHIVGHAALGERLGRNARFASIGNGMAAAVMGVTGSYGSPRAVFLLTAALCIPALVSLLAIGRGPHAGRPDHDPIAGLARSAPADHQPGTAHFRGMRVIIPPCQRGHAAADRRCRYDARGTHCHHDHRRVHRCARSAW